MLPRGRSRSFFRCACNKPRQLHCTVNGFRSAIGEEDAVETGPSGEFAGKRALVRVVIEIRKMNRAGRFSADYFHDAGMRMTEGVDGDAAKKIEILLPCGVKNVSAAPMRHDHWRPFVGGQEELFRIEQPCVLLDGLDARSLGLEG